MKDRWIYGLLPGLAAPLVIIPLFWCFRFRYLELEEFVRQAVVMRIHFKLVAVGVFFADLGLFYLFLRLGRTNGAKGVILAVFVYFFLSLVAGII
ncbi:MAG: hypothetical protein K2O69_05145 [Odoribacter sp.]|nr:hypothetical protein [Odoribacter sp.]